MQPQVPEPTAQGDLATTPVSNLLVYALERSLSGTFELHAGSDSVATLLVLQGFPAKIRTTEGVHHLGEVMVEMGLITTDQHGESLKRMAESPRLQGEILCQIGAADAGRIELGLRAQLERKLEHLFSLPPETVFSYFEGVDALSRYGGPPIPVDPLPVLWRGIRQTPAWEHVDATLRKVGTSALRIAANAQIERFQLGRGEAAAIELLRQRPMRVVDLANAKVVGPSVAQLLVYMLVITRQVDLIEVQSIRPPPTPRTATAPQPVPPMPGAPAGQAFARVQLQAKQITRSPLVVAEEVSAAAIRDERMASPIPASPATPLAADAIPGAPPAPIIVEPARPGSSMDLGALINSTISSLPPRMPASDPAFATPAASSSSSSSEALAGSPSSGSLPPASVSSGSLPASPPSGSLPLEVGASGSISDPPPSSRSIPAPPSSSRSIPAPTSSSRSLVPLSPEQTALKQKILEKAASITSQDYFQMLGLDRNASNEAVQKAFIQLAKIWHPDRLPLPLQEVKDACSKVFTHLTEANATLTDAKRRQEYMTLLKDGGATPDDQAMIQGILEAATEFQKAEFHLKRNENVQAYDLAKRAHTLDPDQADYLAVLTWIEAQRPEWAGRDKTLDKITVLDKCIKMNANCERAYYYRAMLYKRLDDMPRAVKDFKKSAELNPRNLDSAREVRLYNMRGGTSSKAPPGGGRPGAKGPPPDTLGGLFGKLFKK